MSVSTVVPLPGKDLTEAMASTAGRHSHTVMDGSAEQKYDSGLKHLAKLFLAVLLLTSASVSRAACPE